MSLTFTTLKTQIAAYLKRDDLTAYIPSFITMAENEINRRLRIIQREFKSTAPLVAASTTMTLPPTGTAVPSILSDLLDVISVWRTDAGAEFKPLISVPDDMQFIAHQSITAGPPKYFRVIGRQLSARLSREVEFERPADKNYTLGVTYGAKFYLESSSTNWLATYHEEVYLYGALAQAEPFCKNDKRIIIWRTLFEAVIAQLQDNDHEERTNRNATLITEVSRSVGGGSSFDINSG